MTLEKPKSYTTQCPRCAQLGRDTSEDNLRVYPDGSSHCFACGYHEHAKRFKPKVDHVDESKNTLPSDFSREIPARAWQWLLQYGLSYRYWLPYCGYSEKDRRLIFTIGGTPGVLGVEHSVAFSIGRYIPEPGEEGAAPRKWYVYGNPHRQAHLILPEGSDNPRNKREEKQVILVEDIVSAHKVGRYNACIPLFGSEPHDSVVSLIRHLDLPVLFWLDKDQMSGIQKKCVHMSGLTNQPVSYVFTEQDPKACSMELIQKVANGDFNV